MIGTGFPRSARTSFLPWMVVTAARKSSDLLGPPTARSQATTCTRKRSSRAARQHIVNTKSSKLDDASVACGHSDRIIFRMSWQQGFRSFRLPTSVRSSVRRRRGSAAGFEADRSMWTFGRSDSDRVARHGLAVGGLGLAPAWARGHTSGSFFGTRWLEAN